MYICIERAVLCVHRGAMHCAQFRRNVSVHTHQLQHTQIYTTLRWLALYDIIACIAAMHE